MAGTLVILVFHGIGTYRQAFRDPATRFDRPLRDGLQRRLDRTMRDRIVWVPVLWSLEDMEAYEASLVADRDEWEGLFGFVASALCDASAYRLIGEQHPGYPRSNYCRVQRAVHDALARAEAGLVRQGLDPAATPVLAVCHSMGCHILSSYAWDAQNRPERLAAGRPSFVPSPFARLDTLASAVFTGCNLPLLAAGVPRAEKVPLRIRRDAVRWGEAQRWLNIFDPDDLLGYPLEREYRAYFAGAHPGQDGLWARFSRDPAAEVPVEDQRFEMSGPLGLPAPGGLTPLVHNRYWNSDTVLSAIAGLVRDLV